MNPAGAADFGKKVAKKSMGFSKKIMTLLAAVNHVYSIIVQYPVNHGQVLRVCEILLKAQDLLIECIPMRSFQFVDRYLYSDKLTEINDLVLSFYRSMKEWFETPGGVELRKRTMFTQQRVILKDGGLGGSSVVSHSLKDCKLYGVREEGSDWDELVHGIVKEGIIFKEGGLGESSMARLFFLDFGEIDTFDSSPVEGFNDDTSYEMISDISKEMDEEWDGVVINKKTNVWSWLRNTEKQSKKVSAPPKSSGIQFKKKLRAAISGPRDFSTCVIKDINPDDAEKLTKETHEKLAARQRKIEEVVARDNARRAGGNRFTFCLGMHPGPNEGTSQQKWD